MAIGIIIFQRPWPTSILVALALALTLLQTYQPEPESNYAELVSCALAWGIVFGVLQLTQVPSLKNAGDEGHVSWKYWAVAVVLAATEWLGGDMRWLWVSDPMFVSH